MRNLCENVWGIRRGRLGIRIGWDCMGEWGSNGWECISCQENLLKNSRKTYLRIEWMFISL